MMTTILCDDAEVLEGFALRRELRKCRSEIKALKEENDALRFKIETYEISDMLMK